MQIKQLIKISEDPTLGQANKGNRLGQLSALVLDTGLFSEKTRLVRPRGSQQAPLRALEEMPAGRLLGLQSLSEEPRAGSDEGEAVLLRTGALGQVGLCGHVTIPRATKPPEPLS